MVLPPQKTTIIPYSHSNHRPALWKTLQHGSAAICVFRRAQGGSIQVACLKASLAFKYDVSERSGDTSLKLPAYFEAVLKTSKIL